MSTTTLSGNKRSLYWDNIKGFLILFVVFAHILYQLKANSGYINATVDYIYMFHMPAFVFVSGYFGKSDRSRNFSNIFKFAFLYFVFNSITLFIKYHDGLTSLTEPLYSYWYLIALIVWRLTCHKLAKVKGITVILFGVSLIAGFFSSVDNHFSIARIIGFYPFYMLGYKLSEEKNKKLTEFGFKERLLLGSVSLLGASVLAFILRELLLFKGTALNLQPYTTRTEYIGRAVLFVTAYLAIFALRCLAIDKDLSFLTLFGRNSLWIFVLHRMFALWAGDFTALFPQEFQILIALVFTIAICLLFGNDRVADLMHKFISSAEAIFTGSAKKFNFAKVLSVAIGIGLAVIAVFSALKLPQAADQNTQYPSLEHKEDIIYPAMTDSQKDSFDKAFRITFAGDLILLEDQVKLGFNYKDKSYNYDDVFERAKPYISSADLAIGVFEGPMAGEEKGYTTGNFDDGKKLYLNFPDEFATSVKNAGFDLVTTANNHLMDKGEEGAKRTIDVLDKIGLDHTGSYKDASDKEKNRVKLIERDGIKIAVLSYTFCSNYVSNDELIDGQYSYITSMIAGTKGKQFEKLKSQVEEDFKQAKSLSPDLILVLPHIGTQFLNWPDQEQKVWFKIFKDNGADIILGDHPHVVEPVEIEMVGGKKVFTAYCPGNFANKYRENQGDTSMLVDVYIDRNTKQIIGGGIVPLYTYAPAGKNYRAVPIYDIVNDEKLRAELTNDDIARAEKAHSIITSVVFGNSMDVTGIKDRYYFNSDGFLRQKTPALEMTDRMYGSKLYQAISSANSVCFVGDSVTEGTKNGGTPWYEPIEALFPSKNISNFSKGGCTVSYMLDNIDQIPAADLYVIAVGTNDIRYRNQYTCAMTSEEYVKRINELKEKLSAKNANAKFLFIAPWFSTDGDPYSPLAYVDIVALNEEYSAKLEQYCKDNYLMYVNANPYIRNVLSYRTDRTYLLDHIHPNAAKGVKLYSKAVLLSDKKD